MVGNAYVELTQPTPIHVAYDAGNLARILLGGEELRSRPGYSMHMPRFLHTSIFVNNMNESISFYRDKLGLKLLDGPFHYPGNADMAFVGNDWDSYIELVYDLEEHPPYQLGDRYEHLAIEVDGDLKAYVDQARAKGVKVLKDVYKSPSGTRAIAFVEDPNGIPVELLEPRKKSTLS